MPEEGGGDSRIQASGLYALVSTSFLAIISFGPISSGSSSFLDRTNVKIRHQDSLSQQSSFRRRHNHTVSMDPFGMQLVDKPSYIWRRVLLKVSGEALADHSQNIDRKITMAIAREVASVMHLGIEASTCCRLQLCRGDHIFHGSSWALATMESIGIPTFVQIAFCMLEVAEPYILGRAVMHLEKGRVVTFPVGTGNLFFTTVTAAALGCAERSKPSELGRGMHNQPTSGSCPC
uniref:UMP kinase n=1 Tax=Gossypium raimondii TaxID=29730 RepID=A0A0D2TU23_GOSRA|nr:hypothetical protein B456_008G000100 [Gossypium raimondii]